MTNIMSYNISTAEVCCSILIPVATERIHHFLRHSVLTGVCIYSREIISFCKCVDLRKGQCIMSNPLGKHPITKSKRIVHPVCDYSYFQFCVISVIHEKFVS